ncbi:HIG1 domain family member 1A, mitochondrial-like isoform X1 [Octopus bimaculoides]|uniref:HIG1 domain family member 1A, mitochondrial-like isoform X1 n=2 Tax=Octopus bimaculoides TaxID=37653 RepID=UPI0022E2CD11|nr:HIG1 domain family member 1A, mitochondrial-like isoform X1 [Octopus bimaculoides]
MDVKPKMMAGNNKEYPTFEEDNESKLLRKIREAPFMPIGIAGCIGAVAYGIYNYKNRGKMSTSVYLMHLRVKAQGMVVGALTIGVAINIMQKIWNKNGDIEK